MDLKSVFKDKKGKGKPKGKWRDTESESRLAKIADYLVHAEVADADKAMVAKLEKYINSRMAGTLKGASRAELNKLDLEIQPVERAFAESIFVRATEEAGVSLKLTAAEAIEAVKTLIDRLEAEERAGDSPPRSLYGFLALAGLAIGVFAKELCVRLDSEEIASEQSSAAKERAHREGTPREPSERSEADAPDRSPAESE